MSEHHPLRSAGVILYEDSILLIEREKDGKHYFVLPGGGVEGSETVEQAVIREVKEETSLDVKFGRQLYMHKYKIEDRDHSKQYFFLCEYTGGEPKLAEGSNEKELMDSGKQVFKPVWMPISKLPEITLYPLEIRDWLIEDIPDDFKEAPREAEIYIEDLRQ